MKEKIKMSEVYDSIMRGLNEAMHDVAAKKKLSHEIMSLQEIEEQIRTDLRNAEYTARGIPPIYQINPEARILIIGQAPGRKVEESRIPFNDKSGWKLMEWMGIDKDTFYSSQIAIMPMDFYYPGKGKTGDLPPRRFIAEEYHSKYSDCCRKSE